MRTKIKICGLTSPEEAALLDPSHVDAAGMVLFCPKSKRNITIERAVEIIKALPKGIKKVAVTVSPTVEEADLAEKAGFDFLQVHGTMERDFVIHGGLPIIRAVNILEKIPVFEEHERIKAYLFDAATPGSGKTFDWQCLAQIPRDGRKFILAGGLTPFNVGQAIRTVHPYMVDVSSGVEYADRKGKDPAKVAAFIHAVEKEDLLESL
ncbi:phosphoribosylanthranilate isomerase [uncultured Dialister sp.]|uniref:phosphoribosylanthranilate isomerase n=1 Tax=uncultured Dialister sp. TaxID=278064 RepID=UPI00260E7FA9|nr:phosphoribosylanthranilate isomerase [uncultured Dialister sp.]